MQPLKSSEAEYVHAHENFPIRYKIGKKSHEKSKPTFFVVENRIFPRKTEVFRRHHVMNDPVNLIDPSGNCPWCIGAALGGISAGATAYLAGGSARDVAVAAGIGAVAGAASMGVSAFTTTATGIIASNAAIGGIANAATQFANGRSAGQLDYVAIGIGGLAGGIGGAAGLGAGNMAFFGTPTIGNPISMALARSREAWASAITGAAIGTGIESGANVCR